VDFAIGFDSDFLETRWERKTKGNLIGYDWPSNFFLKVFKGSFPV